MVIKCRLYTTKHIPLSIQSITRTSQATFAEYYCPMWQSKREISRECNDIIGMVSMWISVNFRINPFRHEVNDTSICLRIYSIDAIMQRKRQNSIQTTSYLEHLEKLNVYTETDRSIVHLMPKRVDPKIHRNSHTNHSKWSKQTK
jgi:hypothetical protein